MKKIEAIIHPQNWEKTRDALETMHLSATLREVKTFGRTPARRQVYRGSTYTLDTTPEIEMTVFVQDERLESALAAFCKTTGDSEFLVTSVERLVDAREQKPALPAMAPRTVATTRAVSAIQFIPAMTRS